MKLRSKALLLFLSIYLFLTTGFIIISYSMINSAINKYETKEVENLAYYGQEQISNYLNTVRNFAKSWSICDGLYNYTVTPNNDYIEKTFIPKIFGNTQTVDYALILNSNLAPLYEANYNHKTNQTFPTSPIPRLRIIEEGYAERALKGEPVSGFLCTGDNILFISCNPIFKNFQDNKPTGILVIGSRTGHCLSCVLKTDIWKNYKIININDADQMPAKQYEMNSSLLDNNIHVFTEDNKNYCAVLYRDINNTPAFWLLAQQDRTVYTRGMTAFYNFILVIAAFILINIVMIFFFLEHSILSRIRSMLLCISSISLTGDITKRIEFNNDRDEIGAFSNALNRMLERLERDEHELSISNQRFKLIFETSIDAIVWCDPQTRLILNCNHSLAKLTKRSHSSLIGQPYETIFPPEDLYQYLLEKQVKTESFSTESEIIDVKGKRIPVTISSTITQVQGRSVLQSVIHDISDMKIAEERLLRSKNEAEHNSRVKTEFINNVSHELRTPLTAIMGFSELLMTDPRATAHDKWIEGINVESRHLINLVNDLLDNAKVEAGKLTINNEIFDLRKLLNEIGATAEVLARNNEIYFYMNIASSVEQTYYGDPLRIKQTILNLLSNAIKFTLKGSVTLRVSAENQDGTDTLEFSIIDTGIGIAPEQQQEIFKSFQQADPTISRDFGGSGLGTTIALNLTRLMGGDIKLQSTPGQGTIFTVILNLKHIQVDNLEITDSKIKPVKINTKKHLILLIEDYVVNSKIIEAFILAAGHELESTTSAEEAIQLSAINKYDLILTDIQLPDSNGYSVAAHIRKDIINNNTPIVGMTANLTDEVIKEGSASGINDFMNKPFTRDSFITMLDKWLPRSDNSAQETTTDTPTPVKRESKTPNTGAAKPVNDDAEEFLLDINSQLPAQLPSQSTIQRYFLGKTELAEQAFDMFMNDSAKMLHEIEYCLKVKDFDKIQKISHQLKSGTGYMGLDNLHQAFKKINRLSQNKDYTKIPKLIEAASAFFEKVRVHWLNLREQQ